MYWVPSIAISGLAFYTGDRFPAWKGNAFVGSMFEGRTRGTGHLQRITFNEGRPIQREPILTELHQRIRDVRQGPDGLLYVLTDEDNGALLRSNRLRRSGVTACSRSADRDADAAVDALHAAGVAAPNAAGVSMGHLHYRVRDVAANRRSGWRSAARRSGMRQPTRSEVPGRSSSSTPGDTPAAPKARWSTTWRSACRRSRRSKRPG